MKKYIFSLVVLSFGLLHPFGSTDKVFAEAVTPPVGYPLGVSTKTNLTAGGTLYFNTDQLQDKQLVGQFLAKNITSNGSSGLSKGGFQNYQNSLFQWELGQIDPAVVSESITGSDIIRWYANETSFKYINGENLHYYIENLPTEEEMNKALQYYPDLRENFTKRIYKDSLESFPTFVDNGVSNFSQVTSNIQSVSDYYAELIDTDQAIICNSAVQSAEVNTENKVVNPNDWGGQSSIQINIALKKGVTDQAVAIIDVDGRIDHFKNAQDISINYTNYDPDTMLPPYVIINYKHFPSFNFSGSTFFHATAYPSLPGDEEYDFEGNDGVFFEGKYADKAVPLIKSDSHTISEELKDKTYKIATHLVHNFNDEDQEIQFRSNASLFIGTVLAPRASVVLDDTQGRVLGSVISGYDIHTNMPISTEESTAMFDYDDFPGLGEIVDGEALEAPVEVGEHFNYNGLEKRRLYSISQKVPAYSSRFPIQTLKISDTLADSLEVSTADITIKDESGANAVNHFTINKNEENELMIEATPESLADESFYGKTYTIELIGSLNVSQEDLADPEVNQIIIPNTAVVTVNEEAKPSNEAQLQVDFVQGQAIIVKYLNEDGQEIAPTEVLNGKISMPYQAKAKEISGYTLTEVPENETGIFSNEEQTVVYNYHGHLTFSAVPTQINFGTHALSKKDEEYKIESKDNDIVVKDTRTLGSNWQLRATLIKPLTGTKTNRILSDSLFYVEDGQTIPLRTDSSAIIQTAVTTTHDEYNVTQHWESSENGLKVGVKSGEALADQYSGEISWELYDVVSND
ncbi:MucBP domain-containing protein [Candidatus Enterococcus ikei]|uniref:MucBP domain-containing protein n=1 Tax=Candidatus Enterococcus ikei TaxID=2815326 RepID=A0ABS3H0W1_9ENTE|nr:MucBP domain-containing protein [Enterococcus sp. DIV0869a]MBO0440334.1 MucBP domain-containing protein [Enterococcus sp. DIV0869a]